MQDFNTLFPDFLERCLALKGIVTPLAYLLLTGGLIATVPTGEPKRFGQCRREKARSFAACFRRIS